VPERIAQGTLKTLIELGDIKPDAAAKTDIDLCYRPK